MQNKLFYTKETAGLLGVDEIFVLSRPCNSTVTVTGPSRFSLTVAFCLLRSTNKEVTMQNKSATENKQASLRVFACVLVFTAHTKALRDGTHAYHKQSGGHDGDA